MSNERDINRVGDIQAESTGRRSSSSLISFRFLVVLSQSAKSGRDSATTKWHCYY